MGDPGFWEDQEQAAQISAEHARTIRKLAMFRELERDVDDLEPLAELAEEDPELAGEFDEQMRPSRRGSTRSRRSGCSPVATTPATRS